MENPTSNQEAVSQDEFVLRRVAPGHTKPGQTVSVQRDAFMPWPRDLTGLSVYRERYIGPAAIVAAIEDSKRPNTSIARIAVSDLIALGLSIVPEDDVLPGHAVIPV